MKKYILSCLLFIPVFFLHAERIFQRGDFSIVIASDTVYPEEYYRLYVDLTQIPNAEVFRNGMPVSVDSSSHKAYIRFKVASTSFDIHDNGYQSFVLSIKIKDKVIVEEISYIVKRVPVKKYSVKDSIEYLLSENKAYKNVELLNDYAVYENFKQYLKGKLLFQEYLGQLSMAVIIDSNGKVSRYDFIRNSYIDIPKEKYDKVIAAYRVPKTMIKVQELKFGMEVFTFEGYLENVFYEYGVIMDL